MARVEVRVPDLGLETEGIVFGEWLVEPGGTVTAGEDLFEVEADKATVVCEAEASGILADILVTDGPVSTGDLLGFIDA